MRGVRSKRSTFCGSVPPPPKKKGGEMSLATDLCKTKMHMTIDRENNAAFEAQSQQLNHVELNSKLASFT